MKLMTFRQQTILVWSLEFVTSVTAEAIQHFERLGFMQIFTTVWYEPFFMLKCRPVKLNIKIFQKDNLNFICDDVINWLKLKVL